MISGFGQGLLSQNRVLGNTFIKTHFEIVIKISFLYLFSFYSETLTKYNLKNRFFIQNYTIKLFFVRLTLIYGKYISIS
jgi:hypothetical protein